MRTLLDNNIQIYRSICRKWRRASAESTLIDRRPYTTDYVLMEYRRTLIVAIRTLVDLVNRIPTMGAEPVGELDIRHRLGELLDTIINSPSEYRTARRTNLLIQIVTTLMTDGVPFKIVWTRTRLARDLEFWAEELEQNIFHTICAEKQIVDMRATEGGHMKLTKCPLAEGSLATMTCARDKLKCCIASLVHGPGFTQLTAILRTHGGKLYGKVESKLDRYESSAKNSERSIGQGLCWPAGDLVHASTCIEQASAILTSDRELGRLCQEAGIKTITYAPHAATFEG